LSQPGIIGKTLKNPPNIIQEGFICNTLFCNNATAERGINFIDPVGVGLKTKNPFIALSGGLFCTTQKMKSEHFIFFFASKIPF
jgi:hypothetical protein